MHKAPELTICPHQPFACPRPCHKVQLMLKGVAAASDKHPLENMIDMGILDRVLDHNMFGISC